MTGEVELGRCSICGKDRPVSRKYYYYDIKCECCNGKDDDHFEIVWHCNLCKPVPPEIVSLVIKSKMEI